jgi:hypothetical protein
MKKWMVGCLALAGAAAVVYFLMGVGVLTAGNLATEDVPTAIPYIAGGCYIAGGLLIFLRKRWLWITGLVINTLVMVIFFTAYAGKPDIMFSLPGLTTKIAQVILDAGLIYLIATRRTQTQTA